jgi:hypothetical protein
VFGEEIGRLVLGKALDTALDLRYQVLQLVLHATSNPHPVVDLKDLKVLETLVRSLGVLVHLVDLETECLELSLEGFDGVGVDGCGVGGGASRDEMGRAVHGDCEVSRWKGFG